MKQSKKKATAKSQNYGNGIGDETFKILETKPIFRFKDLAIGYDKER